MSTFSATALPSQLLSLTNVWTRTLASRGRIQSPGPSPQESQPAEQGRYRAVSQRVERGGGMGLCAANQEEPEPPSPC